MKWSKHTLTIILVLLTNTQLSADSRIVIYLTHPQREVITGAGQTLKNYKDLPLSGFPCIYAGYLDWSNTDGLVSFPLRHTTPKLYVAITPEIDLANIKENTYSHRKFVKKQPAIIYKFERKTDTKNNLYWEVTTEKIPADLTINPLAIVIITNPENIHIDTGNFITTDGGQMVLPPFYVVGRYENKKAISKFSSIQRFFEPVTKTQEKINDNTTRQLIKTI